MIHEKARDSGLEPSYELICAIEDFDLQSRVFLSSFPRAEKYILGSEIRSSILSIYRLTISANKKYHRKTTLQNLDVEIELMRKLITLAYRRNIIIRG